MMNKRSSRLIAWLLTLVMMLNIAPIPASAGVESSNWTGPVYPVLENLSSTPVPNQGISDYTVQYVIKKEYTYDGKNCPVEKSWKSEIFLPEFEVSVPVKCVDEFHY